MNRFYVANFLHWSFALSIGYIIGYFFGNQNIGVAGGIAFASVISYIYL